jgi:hypothetical protein
MLTNCVYYTSAIVCKQDFLDLIGLVLRILLHCCKCNIQMRGLCESYNPLQSFQHLMTFSSFEILYAV